jgi:phenylacetic acid degradation operon negative regulatory protein
MFVPVTPRSVVLNVVRTAPRRTMPVRQLLQVAELFGFTGNALRVAVARLVADGLLESDERGSYRLGPKATEVQRHVEDWRLGEARMRAWNGGWLAVALIGKPDRAARRESLRALARMGFREAWGGLWVRPDNLALGFEATRERLQALGLEEGAAPFRAHDFEQRLDHHLRCDLWPVVALRRDHERTLRNLERSLAQLGAMPRDTALVQSFLLGGEAIRVLATDPLLPDAILPGATRGRLTEAMLRYDAVGRELWRDIAQRPVLSVLEGGKRVG